MKMEVGYFVVSLDFELFWGMSDKYTLMEYGANVLGERTAIPRMLELFAQYGIHATWATVGMLMARNKSELLSVLPPPSERPVYPDMRISSYTHLESDEVGDDEHSDPYHFGPTLVEAILKTPHQEIGNHTFSHYYVIDGRENGDSVFSRDLDAHSAIAKTYGIITETIVFPRNQTSGEALQVCVDHGIRTYRGNEEHFLYRAREEAEQSFFIRALRLLDHYINISGHHTYRAPQKERSDRGMRRVCVNVPSSRFFRPYMPTLSFLEPLRLRRIRRAMTYAAAHGEVFHLWWHPHNFGINQEKNFENLECILSHYRMLQEKYGMQSASMKEVSEHAFDQDLTKRESK